MKNKAFAFLLIVAIAGFVIGVDYDQAHAHALAQIGGAAPGAWAETDCGGANGACAPAGGCFDPSPGVPPQAAICNSTNGPTEIESRATTAAFAAGWRLRVVIEATIAAGDWVFGGKGPSQFQTPAHVKDTIHVEVDTSVSDTLIIRKVTGKIELYPSDLVGSWMNFNLWGGKLDSTTICFENFGYFDHSGLHITGTPPISFTTSVSNDTLYVYIADTDTILCTVPRDSLMVSLEKTEFAVNVPTTTQWGMIILAGLIVASGVFIMLRRRKAEVPA